jgi:hypothetical protein
MNILSPKSLRWRLVQRIAVTQFLVLVTLSALSFGVVAYYWMSGTVTNGLDEAKPADILLTAITHDANGRLMLRESAKLARLRAETEGLWFVIKDSRGQVIQEGTLPAEVSSLLPLSDTLAYARIMPRGFRGENNQSAVGILRWEATETGNVKIMAGGKVKVTLWRIISESTPAYEFNLYMASIMTVATIFVTIRRAQNAFRLEPCCRRCQPDRYREDRRALARR